MGISIEDLRQQLILSVYGPDHTLDDPGDDPEHPYQLENLIWKAGEHRRQLESAHAWLDTHTVAPRMENGQTFTVRGRLEYL